MPHFANTPEAALPRTDSLDPATTCAGLTSSGKACRRGLSTAATKNDPSSFYCWQHKDQAQDISSNSNNNNNNGSSSGNGNHGAYHGPAYDNRSSIDTMMERLGLEDNTGVHSGRPSLLNRPQRPRRRVRRTFCCCFEVWDDADDGHLPPARPSSKPQTSVQTMQYNNKNSNKNKNNNKKKRTANDWIPPTTRPETASILRTEIEKPLSQKDEPGYIYIFWLTPKETTTRSPPPAEFLSSLLNRGENGGGGVAGQNQNHTTTTTAPRSLSEAIRAVQDIHAFTSKPTSTDPGTIRLKIGRANNVQRRLNEWTRQCSYNLTLIRYYPYTPSHGDVVSAEGAGRKVPYVHRVEHLIHTELGDKRVRDLGKCPECGKEHKEWFEIRAEKEELRRVDECIRRWVSWAESQ